MTNHILSAFLTHTAPKHTKWLHHTNLWVIGHTAIVTGTVGKVKENTGTSRKQFHGRSRLVEPTRAVWPLKLASTRYALQSKGGVLDRENSLMKGPSMRPVDKSTALRGRGGWCKGPPLSLSTWRRPLGQLGSQARRADG